MKLHGVGLAKGLHLSRFHFVAQAIQRGFSLPGSMLPTGLAKGLHLFQLLSSAEAL